MVNINMLMDAIEVVKSGVVSQVELDDGVVFSDGNTIKVHIYNDEENTENSSKTSNGIS